MTAHTKRTCHRGGRWWFNAGILCCALFISILVTTNLVSAVPLTRVNTPGDLSGAWNYKWLIGTMTVTVGPPEGLSEIQELEWTIGTVVGAAEICGYYSKASKVDNFMKKSSYYKIGYKDGKDFDFITGCSQYDAALDTVIKQKEYWESYLGVAHSDKAVLPKASEKGAPRSGEEPYGTKTEAARKEHDVIVCNWGITLKDGKYVWKEKGAYQGHAIEARRRGFTPYSCAKLLGRKVVSSEEE